MGNVLQDERSRSLLLVNLAAIMERADEALLPAVYKELGRALDASPFQLGSLTFVRSLTQSLCFPLAAYLSVHHNRASVIALGAILWAVATFFVGVSTSFPEVAVSRALNGVGLAIVIPAIQSLVADSTDDDNRGTAFGWLAVTSSIGSILGGTLALFLAETTVLGLAGWRLSFHLVAAISLVVAYFVHTYSVDPRVHAWAHKREGKGLAVMWSDLKEMVEEAKIVTGVRTFQIIVVQGIAGSFAWGALAFAPMWLELVGFSHSMTAGLLGLWTVATSCGALFGGKMGDYLSTRLPNTGRIILSQISSGVGVPMAGVLLLALPDDPSYWFFYALVFIVMGFLISWNAPATNNPIFAEIVPEKARTNIYALDRSFESLLAAFAPPFVGYLAQTLFGYVAPASGVDFQHEVATDRKNAMSLAHALYACIGIPLAVCCAVYSFVYCTYPRDRDTARVQSQLDHELEDGVSIGVGHIRLETIVAGENPDEAAGELETSTDATAESNEEKVVMIPTGFTKSER